MFEYNLWYSFLSGSLGKGSSPYRQNESKLHILVHRAILAARSPFFAELFSVYTRIKEEGIGAVEVEEDAKQRVALVFDGTDAEGRLICKEINQGSASAVRSFLVYLYSDSTNHILTEDPIDVLQLSCVYGLGDSRLAFECEKLLKSNMTPINALETLCISHQLNRVELKQKTLNFIVDHFVECVSEEQLLRDAVSDFPDLAVEIMRAVASRVKARKLQPILKRSYSSKGTTATLQF
jgi:hypothetical protein